MSEEDAANHVYPLLEQRGDGDGAPDATGRDGTAKTTVTSPEAEVVIRSDKGEVGCGGNSTRSTE